MKNFLKHHLHYLAWTTAMFAMVGSLFFSNVLGYPPCVLCWYQRIFLYPVVFILGTGILRRDQNMFYYALPLTIIGWGISVYHNLLYYKVIPENLAPCISGVSCTTKFIEYFGFVTIPFLSFVAFTTIIISLIVYRKLNKYE